MPFRRLTFFLLFFLAVGFTGNAASENARVTVTAVPSQAYIFIDGKAAGIGHHNFDLAPGKHTIGVYNYGYKSMVREVELTSGTNTVLNFPLEKVEGTISGPFGVIQIEGAPHAAVLLNGKEAEYFVGHGDEFNNHIWWKQQLLVHPGTHNVAVVYGDKEIWSGKLDVEANKRVVVYLVYPEQPKIVVKDWPEGMAMQSAPRFTVGSASATVAVAPVTGSFAIEPQQINCNEPAKLAWNTTETLHTAITSESDNYPELSMAGEQIVSPHKTATYQFKTSGPGGVIESTETLGVNPAVQATLDASPEVHYLRVGDKVLRQDTTTLGWKTSNADKIVLEPIGSVDAEGTRTESIAPAKETFGPVDETKSYRIVASNVCGGSETKEATVHLVGLVEPNISSVFFPTAYPDRGHPNKGLLASQQEQLKRVATIFKAYLQSVPEAKLTLTGMADERGTKVYNQALSERRVSIVKSFLVAQGIAPEIAGEAKGKEAPLDKAMVKQLETQNPQQASVSPTVPVRTKWLAYNRRVDVAIEPAAIESVRFYPHQASDAQLLFEPHRINEGKIHQASSSEAILASAQ